jgi:hypothetical protein
MTDFGYIHPHQTASTSREHFKTFVAEGLHKLILDHMERHRDRAFCIADLAEELNLERSTVAARFNELKHHGAIAYAGKAKSRTTGVMAMMWRLPIRETLFDL